MNFRALADYKASGLTRIHQPIQNAGPTPMSRRRFAHAAAGTAFAGVVGSRLWRPERAEAGSFAPVPIPGGTPGLGGAYHVFGPAPTGGDPIDAEPSTITNLNGFVGLAYISGMVTQTNLTFAIGAVGIAKPVYFQPAVPQGLHYIFSGARASSGRAAMRGRGWSGRVSLS